MREACTSRHTPWARDALRGTPAEFSRTQGRPAWMHQCKVCPPHTGQDAEGRLLVCVCPDCSAAGMHMGLTTKSVLSVSFPASRSTSAIIIWPPCSAAHAHAGQHSHTAHSMEDLSAASTAVLLVLAWKGLAPKQTCTDTLLGTACTRCAHHTMMSQVDLAAGGMQCQGACLTVGA